MLDFPRFIFPKKYIKFADPETFYIDKLLCNINPTNKLGMIALDAGAGNQNKKNYIIDKGYNYESCDFDEVFDSSAKLKLTYICSVDKMIMPNNFFDLVISVQVLEHVLYPEKVISEMSRVLKPGGYAFLSTNFLYPNHGSPHDYFRFTEFSLNAIFIKNNFKVVMIESHGGFPAMCGQFFHEIPHYFRNFIIFGQSDPFKETKPSYKRLPMLVLFIIPIFVLNFLTQIISFTLHAFDKLDKNKRYALGYSVVAVKKKSNHL